MGLEGGGGKILVFLLLLLVMQAELSALVSFYTWPIVLALLMSKCLP